MNAIISIFEVETGIDAQVKEAFQNRPDQIDQAKVFVNLNIFSPIYNPSKIQLIASCESHHDSNDLHRNHLKESHKHITKGLKVWLNSWGLVNYENTSIG